MTGDDQYIPQHDKATRLATAFREHSDRIIDHHFSHTTQQTHPTTPAHTRNMADTTGDVSQVNIEKFNGVSGLSVGDFIRNVEANGKAKGLTGDALDKHCVSLARNRIDLTKSTRVQDVTRLIDVQPEQAKDWAFVKGVLSASFGEDNEKPEYKFSTLLKAKPGDSTTAGIATHLSNLCARFQEWVKTNTPPEMTSTVNTDRNSIDRIYKFLAVSFLATLVPEGNRASAVDILRETKWDNLAHKTSELINAATPATTPASTFAAQAAPPSPRPAAPAPPRYQPLANQDGMTYPRTTTTAPRYPPQRFPRGRGQIRGGRARGNFQAGRQFNPAGNVNAKSGATYWPTNDQCQRCGRYGHWVRSCNYRPYCAFHNMEGHSIMDCAGFKAAYPSFFGLSMETTTMDHNGLELGELL